MSLATITLLVGGGLIAWQVWTGSAWIVGRHTGGRGLNDAYPEHFVRRDEFPHFYWISIAIQSVAIILLCGRMWWR
jgi:hypothetical protein